MGNNKGPNAPRTNEEPRDENEDDVPAEEYHMLNDQLDQLSGWLDHLEQKNADIHAQLVDLLQKSKKTREEFQQMLQEPKQKPEEMDQTESN